MSEKRPKMPRPAAVAELLASIFQGKPAEKRLKEGQIWLIWEACVGAQIAARAIPAAIRDGILTVTVASAPWMQQLTFLKREIIAKLNETLGEPLVTDIFLKAGKLPATSNGSAKKRPDRTLAPEELEWIATQAALLEDPELRAACETLLLKHCKSTPK